MKLILICLTSMMLMLGLVHADVPKLFTQKPFTSASLAEAVNHYVALGEADTFKELDALIAEDAAARANDRFDRGYSVNERIAWVFRILYTPKEFPLRVSKTGALISKTGEPLRAPDFGMLGIPEKTMPLENWPLFPVALSGSTYVVLKEQYAVKGVPETIQHYMEYCKDNGDFRTTPIPVPTREQALNDVKRLRQSTAWKSIEWVDNSGVSFPYGEQWTWNSINRQAKTITEAPLAGKIRQPEPGTLSLK